MSQYRYTPLDSKGGQVRLLKLEFDFEAWVESAPEAKKPLKGVLEEHYFPLPTQSTKSQLLRAKALPLYSALSYVWGNSDRTHKITINGRSLAITETLYDALRAHQNTANEKSPLIWVDAICVNQGDPHERSLQVKFMREVYRNASTVYIWLGKLTSDVQRCVKFIRNLTDTLVFYDEEPESQFDLTIDKILIESPLITIGNSFLKAAQRIHNTERIKDAAKKKKPQTGPNACLPTASGQPLRPKGADVKQTSFYQESPESPKHWTPSKRQLKRVSDEGDLSEITDLLQRVFINHEWFKRMWVVQELGLADNPSILIQNNEIFWYIFVRAIDFLGTVKKLPLRNYSWIVNMDNIRKGTLEGLSYPLEDLIRECRHRQATDPRDKIYALLGLMGDMADEFLIPSYEVSNLVGRVYANATLHILLRTHSLDNLCSWQSRYRRDDPTWELPSWAPDYTLDQEAVPSPLVQIDGSESIFAASGFDFHSKLMLPNLPNEALWKKLPVHGILIDRVSLVSAIGTEEENFHELEKRWCSTILDASTLIDITDTRVNLLGQLSSLIGKYAEYSAGFIATKTIFEDSPPPFSAYQDAVLNSYMSTLLSGRLTKKERLTDKVAKAILSGKSSDPEITPEFITGVCKAFEMGLRRRRLAILANRSIAAVPEEAKSGDHIGVLFGCSVPVVLREREDGSYQFIGASYLHGYMDGEAIAMERQGTLVQQELILQ